MEDEDKWRRQDPFGPYKREVMEAGSQGLLVMGFQGPRRPPVLRSAHAARDMGTGDLA